MKAKYSFYIACLFFFAIAQNDMAQSDSKIWNLRDTRSVDSLFAFLDTSYRDKRLNSKELYFKGIDASVKLNYKNGISWGYYGLGNYYKDLSMLDSAISTYKMSYEVALELKDYKKLARICGKIGYTYAKVSENELAVLFNNRSRQYAMLCGDTSLFITVTNNLSIDYRHLGMLDSSLWVLKENEQILRGKKDPRRLGSCLQLQAVIFQHQGNVKAALEYYYSALEVLKQVEDKAVSLLIQVDIASMFIELKEYSKALEILNEIKDGYLKRIESNITFYNMMGMTWHGLQKYDSAYYYFQRSIGESIKTNQLGKAVVAYYNIGKVLNDAGRYEEALPFLTKGLGIGRQFKIKKEHAATFNTIGTTYLNLGNLNQAEKSFTEALLAGTELKDISILKDANDGLSKVNAQKGNYKKAYNYVLLYKKYNDSILNAQNISDITQKNLEYEFDKEKASIARQQEQERLINQELVKRQRLVRNSIILVCVMLFLLLLIMYRSYLRKKKADNEKQVLLKEIHHRVKNNLQVVSSLLNIQTEYTNDTKVIGAVQESQSRVKAMALIHQLLYQEENFTRIDFREYLQQLTKTLAGIFKQPGSNISTQIIAEKIALDIDTSIPLGLIVTELVSNAYKYAFVDRMEGIITIELKKNENLYELLVTDNGKGLDNRFDLETSASMGLKLVKILTDQIDGNFSIYNKQGTTARLVFEENN